MTMSLASERPSSSVRITRRQAIGAMGGLAFACACAQGARAPFAALADEQEKSDTLRMAISVDPDGLDPQRTAAAATFEITNNLYDPLLRVTTDGELVEGLATAWEISEDGLTLTFTLRDGVSFSNGNPCDADAVLASFQRLQSGDSPRNSEYAGYTFEAPDKTTFVARTEELNVAAITDFAYAWSAVVDASVGDDLRSNPVGTGPYVLADWTPQQSLTLAANDAYWGDAPLTPNVELKEIPDATTQVSALRSGEVDWILADSSQVAPFEGDDSFQVLQEPMNAVQLMAMNCSNEALSDERVRQAINMAVNKDELIETVWWGYGQKIGSHYPTVLKEYVDCNDTYAYDPDGARALLEEAGYADNLTLKMRLPKDYPYYVDAGQVIADYLSKVGITCDIEIIEWATWLDEVYNNHVYDLTVVGHTGRLDPITLLARYRSDSSENYFEYKSDEVDQLIDSYRSELDEDKRVEIAQDIQRKLAEDVPALYIQTPVLTYVTKKSLEGFENYPIDIYELSDITVGA
jgi:peptide/nickel transport system substrate-binding protein